MGRNSEGATLAMGHGGIIKFTLTDTKSPAWKKENALMVRGMDMLTKDYGLDVGAVAIDDREKMSKLPQR
jgi:hypothetical protein